LKTFAEYGFNKSHSTAYAYLAYQTAFLKAHYQSISVGPSKLRIGKTSTSSKIINTFRKQNGHRYPASGHQQSQENFRRIGLRHPFRLIGLKSVSSSAWTCSRPASRAENSNFNDFVVRVDLSKVNKVFGKPDRPGFLITSA
jgi:DNA polymerase-3 subunit alpha